MESSCTSHEQMQTPLLSNSEQVPVNETQMGKNEEDQPITYFVLKLSEIEKQLDTIVENMQHDLETIFGDFVSSFVSTIQNEVQPIHHNIEVIREKNKQYEDLNTNLQNAEEAIQLFYQCLEER